MKLDLNFASISDAGGNAARIIVMQTGTCGAGVGLYAENVQVGDDILRELGMRGKSLVRWDDKRTTGDGAATNATLKRLTEQHGYL